jgi:hypothetical protein
MVDTLIYELLEDLTGIEHWDIEIIGQVRDAIWEAAKDHTTMTKMDFYPYIEE